MECLVAGVNDNAASGHTAYRVQGGRLEAPCPDDVIANVCIQALAPTVCQAMCDGVCG